MLVIGDSAQRLLSDFGLLVGRRYIHIGGDDPDALATVPLVRPSAFGHPPTFQRGLGTPEEVLGRSSLVRDFWSYPNLVVCSACRESAWILAMLESFPWVVPKDSTLIIIGPSYFGGRSLKEIIEISERLSFSQVHYLEGPEMGFGSRLNWDKCVPQFEKLLIKANSPGCVAVDEMPLLLALGEGASRAMRVLPSSLVGKKVFQFGEMIVPNISGGSVLLAIDAVDVKAAILKEALEALPPCKIWPFVAMPESSDGRSVMRSATELLAMLVEYRCAVPVIVTGESAGSMTERTSLRIRRLRGSIVRWLARSEANMRHPAMQD